MNGTDCSRKKGVWRNADFILRNCLPDMGKSTLDRILAERRLSKRCAKKMGGRWYFNVAVIESEGLIFADE